MNKFNIGEIVIRQAPAPYYEKFNGEYKVVDILTSNEYIQKYSSHMGISDYYYELEGFSVEFEDFDGNPLGVFSNHSAEAFLRKKHDGSSFSFSQLMCSLKQPSLIGNEGE